MFLRQFLVKRHVTVKKCATHGKNVLRTNKISQKKCLFIKLLRSLASVLLVSPISSASLVKTALVSTVGRGADTFFFFCITQKIKENTMHVQNL